MKSAQFIQRKFRAWADRQAIALQGSAGERGELNYTRRLEDNLFGGVLENCAKAAIEAGAGGELRGGIPKMAALHSSAAMAINLFQYWIAKRDFSTVAELLEVPSLGITDISFERRYEVCSDWKSRGFNEPPHLDLGIDYDGPSRVGVECKLFEPYGRLDHQPLKQPYIDLSEAWTELPRCLALAQTLREGTARFHRLGAAQLVRHLLGLRFGKAPQSVRLIYLYYDAIGDEGAEHRDELHRFCELIKPDPIRFVPMTVQEFVVRAHGRLRTTHPVWVDYLTDRYL